MTIHIHTPLFESRALSARSGKSVFLKMEAMQPTGSFKARGIGHACSVQAERGARRFVSSSGGNAGLAVAYAGRRLGVPVTVVVPTTTSERAKALIALEDAQVIVHGASWNEANEMALGMLGEGDAFIHPFDDPLLWEGHATLIDEVALESAKPDAIILSVGGGGLLCGVVEGLRRNAWADVPVIAVETQGAESYARSVVAGSPVTLPNISSIATSLGARTPCAQSVALAKVHPIESVVVSDVRAVAACRQFLADHRVVVEPACGASLAALEEDSNFLSHAHRVLVIVCGGVGASPAQLEIWDAALKGSVS